MMNFFIACLIGVIAGTIDILPMIKMKLDAYSTASAFLFYVVLTFMIVYTQTGLVAERTDGADSGFADDHPGCERG